MTQREPADGGWRGRAARLRERSDAYVERTAPTASRNRTIEARIQAALLGFFVLPGLVTFALRPGWVAALAVVCLVASPLARLRSDAVRVDGIAPGTARFHLREGRWTLLALVLWLGGLGLAVLANVN